MKLKPELFFIVFLFSCVYDPPLKGKDVWVHNQTRNPLFIIDSLTGSVFKLYDTAIVNGRRYINRQSNFTTEYGFLELFYSNEQLDKVRRNRKNKITLYFVDQAKIKNQPNTILSNRLYRFFDLNIDTLTKYKLNHLFILEDTVLFEHHYDYSKLQQ